jgi:hypothetical protein
MSRSSLLVSFALLGFAASACSSSPTTPSGSGGSTGSGGAGSGGAGSGGAPGSGGAGSGGAPGSGGASGTGGASMDVAPEASVDLAASDAPDAPAGDLAGRTMMTFFITSTGSGAMGGNLGGLAGADAKCQMLATAVGAGGRTWHAYLSTAAAGGMPAVNARDRIGAGPWHNQKGVMIAADLAALHVPATNLISVANGLDETGMAIPTNQHDIATGSTAEGMLAPGADTTCANWTSNAATGVTARVGHFNRMGGGEAPTSWNSAHATPNCTQASIQQVAGAARTYCFAVN